MKSSSKFWRVVLFASAVAVSNVAGSADLSQTGAFTLSYTAEELLGDEASRVAFAIANDEVITWEIYVPPDYSPDSPFGLFVYVSPKPSGKMPTKWRRVMDEHKLIWIGANKSGNRVVVGRRMLFAVLAVVAAERSYSVDAERLYVSGFSGGGKIASRLATVHADTFKGGFFIGGVLVGRDALPRDSEVMKTNHYVFLCGSKDQALRSCKQAYRAYRADGLENTELMVIRGMGHNTPDAADLAKGIVFLDRSDSASE
jgi:predicted esterase